MQETGDAGLIPGSGTSPGEGMVTHSRILAWTIPGTEEPGGLQSTGSQTWTRLSDFASLWFLLAASRGEAGKSWPARREPSPGTGLWLVGQGGAGSVGDVDGWGGEGEEEHR